MTTANKRTKAGRRAGRPSGDDQDLRRRLLDAAIAQFARTGIAATSLRAIATEAGVTPAMLHYYFGDKARFTEAPTWARRRRLDETAAARKPVRRWRREAPPQAAE